MSRALAISQAALKDAEAAEIDAKEAENEADVRAAVASRARNSANVAASNNAPTAVLNTAIELALKAEKVAAETKETAKIRREEANRARVKIQATPLLPGELPPPAYVQKAVADINSRTSVNSSITSSTATVTRLQTISQELLDDLEKLKTEISGITTQGPINDVVARLTTSVSAVDAKLVELQGRIESTNDAFSALIQSQSQKQANDDLVSKLTAAQRDLKKFASQLTITANAKDEEIQNLKNTLRTNSSGFSSLETSISGLVRGVMASVNELKSAIDAERASLFPAVKQLTDQVQKVVTAVETLASMAASQPQTVQLSADATAKLEEIRAGIAAIPAALKVPASPASQNATVDLTSVITKLDELKKSVERTGVAGNSAPANAAAPSPATPEIKDVIKDVNYALQQAIEQYKNYVRNAGDAVPYLKRPYRTVVYYDVSEKRHKTRGVPALVPSREFSNMLATGCGALGQAVTALANARSARARTHVQHPHASLGVLRMNTVVVGHPAGPAARGVVPLDAPGHLAMALHDDVVAAEYAVQQAFHELEGKLSPYEVFRVFPPGDDRRDAVMPTDVDDMFRHAASLEATRALDRILARVHVRSASCWPQQGINPFDTLEALQKHVYALVVPRTQPSAATLDRERLAGEALERQIAAHEARQREARIYREARDAAREATRKADLETAQIARQARLVARV
jgi:hypothetical protein